jgi:hypothetical protein
MGNSDAARNRLKWRLVDRTALASCDITKLSLKIVARPFAFGADDDVAALAMTWRC